MEALLTRLRFNRCRVNMGVAMKHAAYPLPSRAWGRRVGGAGLYRNGGKRALDLALTLCAAPLALPLIALLWLLVRAGGAPGFFAHIRIGRHGRPFRCWKLRTMRPDAAECLARLLAENPHAAAEWADHFKLRFDPRITRIGRFLRRSSLDELPQLLNVLRGEMSLVGPRPVTREELPRYGAAASTCLSCRPGLTGPWQVSGRNDISYRERVRLDAHYARSHGLSEDVLILLRTVRVVLAKTGL